MQRQEAENLDGEVPLGRYWGSYPADTHGVLETLERRQERVGDHGCCAASILRRLPAPNCVQEGPSTHAPLAHQQPCQGRIGDQAERLLKRFLGAVGPSWSGAIRARPAERGHAGQLPAPVRADRTRPRRPCWCRARISSNALRTMALKGAQVGQETTARAIGRSSLTQLLPP